MATKRVCKCGAIIQGKCPSCYQPQHNKTTAERGYGNDWRKLSERKRAADPLCERCLGNGRTEPARHVHHIKPISDRPDLRLEWSNLMSVCVECHEELERGSDTGG